MVAHTILTIHHFVFLATSSAVVFRMNQWVSTIKTITTDTLIISTVASNATPLVVRPNMDDNNLQAVEKSGERKNTHVTFTKKKVRSAIAKLLTALLLKNEGAKEAEVVT